MKRTIFLVLILIPFCISLYGQTIAEKKKGLVRGVTDLDPQMEAALIKVNQELELKKESLSELYADVYKLHRLDAEPKSYEELLRLINETKAEIQELNQDWQKMASQSSKTDMYALWHQPDSTIEQLVLDYGAQDYVYVMTPELGEIRISVNSNIPIPKASWENMLDMILSQNGIGIRQLNPYLRELYEIQETTAPVTLITNRPQDLAYLPPEQRIAFIITPDPADVKRTWTFLNKFVNPKTTLIEQIGREVLVISQVSDIQDLLKLYDFVASSKSQRQYKLVPLAKIKAEEMAKVLSSMFDHLAGESTVFETESGKPEKKKDEDVVNGLKIIVLESLSQAVFLVGTEQEIQMAEQMIHRIESKIGGGRQKVVQWYRVKHSSAQDLADVLQQIYIAMITQKIGFAQQQPGLPQVPGQNVDQEQKIDQNVTVNDIDRPYEPFPIFDNDYYLYGEPVVDPGMEVNEKKEPAKKNPNFIVDEKTGSIIMVVEKDLLPRLMEIMAKLDTPKKMVQIDVLVFERRSTERTDYGLNLLKIGGCADNKRLTCVDWDQPAALGIFEFLLSRPKTSSCAPAFDLIYKFLLTQDNISLNANPSVVTINQTPAEINIVDEISITTGVNFIATTNANTPRDSFVRAQYGITIKVTPTVHLRSESDEYPDDDVDYVTLETYITFDTIEPVANQPDRPNVLRRELTNEVLIADGQTLVMGGLRRKETNDQRQSIPFFGEIPGFGKLFSMTEMEDRTTELIIFMTPKIIHDPCEDIERVKFKKLSERPGDLPSFLCRLNESLEQYQRRAFVHTIKMLCGNPRDHYTSSQIGCYPASLRRGGYCSCGEYDGR